MLYDARTGAVPGYCDSAYPGNTRIAVRGVAHQGEEIGNQAGLHAELLAHPVRVANGLPLAVHLDHPVAPHTLRQVLVGRPDADFLHAVICRSDARRGGERVVGLELDHGPYHHAHGGEGVFQRVELRQQGGLDPIPRFVPGPECVAEGLDDVVGRHAEMRGSLLDHLQYRVQHSDDRAERLVLALSGATPAVELPEQLVRDVQEVNDHRTDLVPTAPAPGTDRPRCPRDRGTAP